MSCYGCYGSLPNPMAGVGYFGGMTGNFGMYGLAPAPINPDPIDPLGLGNMPMYGTPATEAPQYLRTPSIGTPSIVPAPAPIGPIPPAIGPLPTNPILSPPSPTTSLSAPGTLAPSIEPLPVKVSPPNQGPIIPQPKSGTPSGRTNASVSPAAGETPAPLSGSIIIKLPANAKLYVDDNLIKGESSAERHFHSPALEKGSVYFYMVRVEVMKDDKRVTEEQKVRVRAGETTNVSFNHLKSKEQKDPTSVAEAR
jgi:uncharacterized protein (TIGR03000 family)